MEQGRALVERYLAALERGDVDEAQSMYAEDAQVVRYEGVVTGRDGIHSFLVGFLTVHGGMRLFSIDQIRSTEDVVVWDATLETDAGPLQVTDVMILDSDGLIARHLPLIRGFWGTC